MTKEDKILLHRYGCFITIILVMFFTLFALTKLNRAVWHRNLSVVVNQVLASNEATAGLCVLDSVELKTGVAASSDLFIVGQDNAVNGYAVILRLTGPSGPLSGVFFTRSPQQTPVFIGSADKFIRDDQRRIVRSVDYSDFQLTAAQISFWSDKAALLIQEAIK